MAAPLPVIFTNGRIAISHDGNKADADDIFAVTMQFAMITTCGVQDKFVHMDICDNLGAPTEPLQYQGMLDSLAGRTRFPGLPTTPIYFDDRTQLAEAIANFKAQAEAGSETNILYYLCCGPMEVPWRMLQAVDPAKRKYIHCITHSAWNNTHLEPPNSTHTWTNMVNDFGGPDGAKFTTVSNGLGHQDWSFLLNMPAAALAVAPQTTWTWMYNVQAQYIGDGGPGDCSDTCMTWWLLTGSTLATVGDVRERLENPIIPSTTGIVVSVSATAQASEPSTNGVYTFSRTGDTSAALTVNYVVTGAATSGTDYTDIGTSVTIPAGQASATKTVVVLSDTLIESAETVIVTLASNADYTVGAANSATVTIADAPPPPPLWVTADIGAVGAVGNASFDSGTGTWTIKGSGKDVIGAADEFRYVSQSSSGDCSVVAKVASIQNTNAWAKAGVMIRESTAAGSRNFFVFVTPTSGVAITWRSTTGGTTNNTTAAVTGQTAPKWLKLTRAGNVFAAYRSNDGITWTQVGTSQTISMAASATLGLAVTSHADGTLCTSTMINVTATP